MYLSRWWSGGERIRITDLSPVEKKRKFETGLMQPDSNHIAAKPRRG
jgi:hypothetical protein